MRPWEVALLTPSQLNALTGEIGFIRYQRDLPMREYAFSKLGKEGWKELVEGNSDGPDPYHDRAKAIWYGPYKLPEYRPRRMTRSAAHDLKVAIKRNRVPGWVMNLLSPDEFKQLTTGGEEPQ